jgi:hypothetical protein
MNKNPKIFLGPMSKTIVDSVIDFVNKNSVCFGLIPSRRQIEKDGGYVNNWTTKSFIDYIKTKTDNVLLVRDHCGPSQGILEDDGIESFIEDCKYFDVIHIDVWKKHTKYFEGLNKTIEFINLGYEYNTNLLYEVGTEEAIRKFSVEELDNFLSDLKTSLNPHIFSKIKYLVIQSGTKLEKNNNTGNYNPEKMKDMINLAKKYNLISKEHNADYLSNEILEEKFKAGLDSINIAPEIGQIETKTILSEIKKINSDYLFNNFFDICLNSKKWIKWVSEDYLPEKNKEELINICGHYVFSHQKFKEIKDSLPDIDIKIKKNIKNRLIDLLKITNKF